MAKTGSERSNPPIRRIEYGQRFESSPVEYVPDGRIVLDWRTVTDDEFLDSLKPLSARLSKAKKIWRKDAEKAKALVVEHFLERRAPRWNFDFRRKAGRWLPTRNFFFGGRIREEWARRSLRYEFYDYNAEGNFHRVTSSVDWEKAFAHEIGSAGWLTLGFAYWGLFPAAAYASSRDPRYARVFSRCFRRWQERFPTVATDKGLLSRFNFNTLEPSFCDTFMETGRRALVMTDVLHSGLAGALSVPDAFQTVKYIWFICRMFRTAIGDDDGSGIFKAGNHNLFDLGCVPFCLGAMFPEFAEAAVLEKTARKIICRHASDPDLGAIRPDGSSWEHSSRYAWYAAGMFQLPLEIARLNRRPLLDAKLENRVLAFLDHFADITAPDGMLIPYGDCQPPPQHLHLGLAPALLRNSHCELLAQKLGVQIPLHREAPRSPAPRRTWPLATRFPESGLIISRTGWTSRDSLLFIIADPRTGYLGHSHHDFGSFQLWCDGLPVFADTATWAYRIDRIVSSERGYHYSAFAHNLLAVEDYRPAETFARMGSVFRWWGDSRYDGAKTLRCELDGPAGLVEIQHREMDGMEVRRVYSFDLAAHRIEICDTASAVGSKSLKGRIFRQWLHPWFGLRPAISGNGRMSLSTKASRIHAEWGSDEKLSVCAEPDPELFRAARVFRFGRPWRVFAQTATEKPILTVRCRIEWKPR